MEPYMGQYVLWSTNCYSESGCNLCPFMYVSKVELVKFILIPNAGVFFKVRKKDAGCYDYHVS